MSISNDVSDSFSYPDKMHYTDEFENALLYKNNKVKQKEKFGARAFNSKLHVDFKKSQKKLTNKQIHVFIPWSVVEKDVDFIKKNNVTPNKDGLIIVERDNQKRTYKRHDDRNKRLYPVNGDSMINLSGLKAYELTSKFLDQKVDENMMEFLKKNLNS